MNKIALAVALTTALCCTPLLTNAAEGGSIASKVEALSPMTYLQVSDLRAAKRDGLLRVQVTISNSSTSKQQLYYRFRWLDDDGFTVGEDEAWKPETIYAQQRKVINTSSPNLKATDFRVELQSPE